ncbi:MAG: metallophosphoesterase family protein [Rhizomicrobium sp.]
MFDRWFRKPEPPPAVPQGTRVYAIGDIHGRSDLLDRLLMQIRRESAVFPGQVVLVFIGDYVDRGRDSKGVIDILVEARQEFQTRLLRGNHDQSMLNFIANPNAYPAWRDIGGADTLWSYGVSPPKSADTSAYSDTRDRFVKVLPPAHVEIFQILESAVEIGDYLFVHAGVRPGIPLESQDPMDLMWIRDEFLTSKSPFEKMIVHGHSPMREPARKSNRISIDTGAYASGRLTAAVFEGTDCRFLQS